MNRILLMCLRNFWLVPKMWFKLCHYAKHTEDYPEQEKYDHIRFIMTRAVVSGNIDLHISGQENLPKKNGFILYGNHQGMFDVVAIAHAFSGPLAAVFKKELKDVPFLKQVIQCTKSFAMDREDVRQSLEVIRAVTEEVKKGRNYLIFPEGTRSRKGNEMLEFHGGSFRSAIKAKCPIVPFAMIDSYKVLDEKGCKPVKVQLHYLKPILPEDYEGMKTTEVAELVKARIAEKIQECT